MFAKDNNKQTRVSTKRKSKTKNIKTIKVKTTSVCFCTRTHVMNYINIMEDTMYTIILTPIITISSYVPVKANL